MRLTHIKLSGFKSFVDATSIGLPGMLVGVVGPNGCGKSNIMDAVRWVLGESKASELRGESMQDVIFNGSTNRKPSARSSVELVFDNSMGRIGGQWGTFSEISVKRVLTRDGASSYYINNQVVRRRDVQDIFLGTGLGPRAYAIIGQGTISRIIESKPEELRVFLEEAAGVSKYKERRRETENRLSDTRDNLTRVQDLLRELESQVDKLGQQAEVAKQYHDIKGQLDQTQKMLWFARKRDAATERARVAEQIAKTQTQLEEQLAGIENIELQITNLQTAGFDADNHLQLMQNGFFEANSAVSRLEQEIRHVVDKRDRINAELGRIKASVAQWESQMEQADTGMADGQAQLASLEEAAEQALAVAQDSAVLLPQLEQQLSERRTNHGQRRTLVTQIEQQLRALSDRQREIERQLTQSQLRKDRLLEEKRGVQAPDQEQIEVIRGDLQGRQDLLDEVRAQLEDIEQQLPTLDEQRRQAQEKAGSETAEVARLEARLLALQKLQEDVQTHGKIEPWLNKHGLAQRARLWQRIHIEPGWEPALESVLAERMTALEVNQLDLIKAFTSDAPPSKTAFFTPPVGAQHPTPPAGFKPLHSLVRVNEAALNGVMEYWLSGVYVADTVEAALAQRNTLPAGARFVVKAGHQIDLHSVRFFANDSDQAGMLARQQEIENLTRSIKGHVLIADEARSAVVRTESVYQQQAQALQTTRSRTQELTARTHDLQLELLRLTQAFEQANSSASRIEQELTHINEQIEELNARKVEEENLFEQLDQDLADKQASFEDELLELESFEAQVVQSREQVREHERASQQAQFAQREMATQLANFERSIEFAKTQHEQAGENIERLMADLEEIQDESARAGLEDALAKRFEAEQLLATARTQREDLFGQQRELSEKRMSINLGLDPLRQQVTNLKIREEAVRVAEEQATLELEQAGVDEAALADVVANMPNENVKASSLQGSITRLTGQIEGLGAVNLAALQELEQAAERKNFLDAQQKDLLEAITTLEDAIAKIDKETRDLLQGTFDAVNENFGKLFPELFGGGQAKLVMTGDQILDSGVQVMAHPPGKRNGTIHLLSGGEKALTATALVFSIFLLNPAPFCLLDEVDAPLDDANTERYANMVKRMAQETQFLFISHNKIAMEMAQQLVGVTMQEPGVSRIVAVDIDAAVQFAQAA